MMQFYKKYLASRKDTVLLCYLEGNPIKQYGCLFKKYATDTNFHF